MNKKDPFFFLGEQGLSIETGRDSVPSYGYGYFYSKEGLEEAKMGNC